MIVKQLTEQHLELLSLKGGCTDSSVSTLVKISHCRKSHVTAHFNSDHWFRDKYVSFMYRDIRILVTLSGGHVFLMDQIRFSHCF